MSGAAMVWATNGLVGAFMGVMAATAGYDMFIAAPEVRTLKSCAELNVTLEKHSRVLHRQYLVSTGNGSLHNTKFDDRHEATTFYHGMVRARGGPNAACT